MCLQKPIIRLFCIWKATELQNMKASCKKSLLKEIHPFLKRKKKKKLVLRRKFQYSLHLSHLEQFSGWVIRKRKCLETVEWR